MFINEIESNVNEPMILHIAVHISMKEQWITPPNQEILHHCGNKLYIKLLT